MEKQTYPYYMVHGYRCDTYHEAYQLAQVVAERTNRPVSINEKLDAMTSFYSVGIVQPQTHTPLGGTHGHPNTKQS